MRRLDYNPLMNLLPSATMIVFGFFALTSCKDKKETALDAFKEQVEALDLSAAVKAIDLEGATAESDLAGMFNAVFALSEKLAELKADGLPDDLGTATAALQKSFADMTAHIKAMPVPMEVLSKGDAGMRAWIGEKIAADPSFIEGFQKEMATWKVKMGTLGATLEEKSDEIEAVFKKYEIPIEFPEDKDGE